MVIGRGLDPGHGVLARGLGRGQGRRPCHRRLNIGSLLVGVMMRGEAHADPCRPIRSEGSSLREEDIPMRTLAMITLQCIQVVADIQAAEAVPTVAATGVENSLQEATHHTDAIPSTQRLDHVRHTTTPTTLAKQKTTNTTSTSSRWACRQTWAILRAPAMMAKDLHTTLCPTTALQPAVTASTSSMASILPTRVDTTQAISSR